METNLAAIVEIAEVYIFPVSNFPASVVVMAVAMKRNHRAGYNLIEPE